MCSEAITLVSIAPNLKGSAGHDLVYHQSVGQALGTLGWQHDVLIPQDALAADIPSHWQRSLMLKKHAKWNVFGRLLKSLAIFKAIKRDIQSNVQCKSRIYFLESFSSSQYAAVVLALLTTRAKATELWVLHRYRADQMRLAGIPNRIIQWVADCFGVNTKLFTDTTLLAQSLSKTFGRRVIDLPIPHIDSALLRINEIKVSDHQIWWWPGPPRKEKGWDVVRKIASEKNDTGKGITLTFAKSANISACSDGVKTNNLPNSLSREEYLSQLINSNMVLLPYDANTYGMSSSGIFVEAVCAMVIPVVNEGTWMASELKRYDLNELIVDWNANDLVQKLLSLSSDEFIRNKFRNMSMTYRKLHGFSAFGSKLTEAVH